MELFATLHAVVGSLALRRVGYHPGFSYSHNPRTLIHVKRSGLTWVNGPYVFHVEVIVSPFCGELRSRRN